MPAKHPPRHVSGDDPQDTAPSQPILQVVEGLIQFSPPDNPSLAEQKLVAEIVILDHRTHNQLVPGSREWGEVNRLLLNVVVLLQARDAARGRQILKEAERIYFHHNQTKNRIRYLIGSAAGIAIAALLGALLVLVPTSIEKFVSPQFMIPLFAFAGMGAMTSILTRISSIDLRKETSHFSVYISGLSRPVIAIFFSIVVYVILNAKIVDISFNGSPDGQSNAIYLVASFLCGFSERFAKDIIARVPGAGPKESEDDQIHPSA